jgi:hypothetical protein
MKISVILLVSLLLINCSSDNIDTNFENSKLEFVSDGGLNYENDGLANKNWVISSQSELESNFSIDPEFVDSFQDPLFNFNTHVMLIATDEIRNTGGYSLDIQFERERGNTIYLKVEKGSPDGPIVTLPLSIPFQVKKYPKTNMTLSFEN